MSELINQLSGIADISVQARDIDGGLHFHLTVPDPFRSDAARRVKFDEQTADVLATVLRDLGTCLTALGIPESELPTAIDQVTRAVLLKFRREYDPTPQDSPAALSPQLQRFVSDLAAYVEPERLLRRNFYFSTRKVIATHRAYQHQLPEHRSPTPTERFLALYQYFRTRDQVVFGPARLLPGNELPDGDQWVFFTGQFELSRDDGALDRMPGARDALDAGHSTNLYNIVTTVFGASDPFFYPYVEFRGRVGALDAVMIISRKHLVLGSDTVTALARALRGEPLPVAGFGTFESTDSGLLHVHPIVFRDSDR